jgi:hypothetical protein
MMRNQYRRRYGFVDITGTRHFRITPRVQQFLPPVVMLAQSVPNSHGELTIALARTARIGTNADPPGSEE